MLRNCSAMVLVLMANTQGGQQARQPPLAAVVRTEAAALPSTPHVASASMKPSLSGPSMPHAASPSMLQQQQQAGEFSFSQPGHQQHGASGDDSFAFDVGQQPQSHPRHTGLPPQQQRQQQQQQPRGGQAGANQGGSMMARARERMASHASSSPGFLQSGVANPSFFIALSHQSDVVTGAILASPLWRLQDSGTFTLWRSNCKNKRYQTTKAVTTIPTSIKDKRTPSIGYLGPRHRVFPPPRKKRNERGQWGSGGLLAVQCA
eukprot:1156303-Pelagomonas_calceolata.AAC.5